MLKILSILRVTIFHDLIKIAKRDIPTTYRSNAIAVSERTISVSNANINRSQSLHTYPLPSPTPRLPFLPRFRYANFCLLESFLPFPCLSHR